MAIRMLAAVAFFGISITPAVVTAAGGNAEFDVLDTNVTNDLGDYADIYAQNQNAGPFATNPGQGGSDIVFNQATYTNYQTFVVDATASPYTVSTLNDLSSTTLTLGSGGLQLGYSGSGNSVAPSTSDLLYVASGSTLITSSTFNLVVGNTTPGVFDIAGTANLGSVTGSSGTPYSLNVGSTGQLILTSNTSSGPITTITLPSVILNGGQLQLANTGSLVVSQTLGALTLNAASSIYFNGVGTLSFPSISGLTNSNTLSIFGWQAGDTLTIGSSQSLTSAQLADITFYTGSTTTNGTDLGTAIQGATGNVMPVPEPSTALGAFCLLGLVAFRERRWFLRCAGARRLAKVA